MALVRRMRHIDATRGCEALVPMVIRRHQYGGATKPRCRFKQMEVRMRRLSGLVSGALVAAALQGCAAQGNDPGANSLPSGQSCQTIRGELNKLDARGVQSVVERASNGGKLTPAQRADADLYNRLLSQYLGSRCHV